MKNLFESWRNYLIVEQVKFSGILKLMPDPSVIRDLQQIAANLPEEAVSLPEDKWHVTLIHQSVLKPYRKELKAMGTDQFPEPPAVIISPKVEERVDEELGRKSWIVRLENQDDMKQYVNQVMKLLKAPPDPEPDRIFHISLANLTGNPGDSVK